MVKIVSIINIIIAELGKIEIIIPIRFFTCSRQMKNMFKYSIVDMDEESVGREPAITVKDQNIEQPLWITIDGVEATEMQEMRAPDLPLVHENCQVCEFVPQESRQFPLNDEGAQIGEGGEPEEDVEVGRARDLYNTLYTCLLLFGCAVGYVLVSSYANYGMKKVND